MTGMTIGSLGPRMVSDSRKGTAQVIARPPPLAQASRCGGERSPPPRARQAPRSATAARRSHRPGRPRPVASPRVRGAMCDRMGSRRAGPAAATPPPMTTRLTPRVRASDRIARARWSATRSMISSATSSPADAGAEDVGGSSHRATAPCSDRRRSPRRPGERSPDRRRSSRGSRADRTRRRRRPDRRRGGRPRRRSCCRRGALPRRGRCRPRCRSRSRGRRRSPARRPDPSAALPAQPERRRAGVVLDEDRDAKLRLQHRSQRQMGDAQVDGHADRAVLWVDVAGDGDADRGDVLPQVAPGVVDESGDLVDER